MPEPWYNLMSRYQLRLFTWMLPRYEAFRQVLFSFQRRNQELKGIQYFVKYVPRNINYLTSFFQEFCRANKLRRRSRITHNLCSIQWQRSTTFYRPFLFCSHFVTNRYRQASSIRCQGQIFRIKGRQSNRYKVKLRPFRQPFSNRYELLPFRSRKFTSPRILR